MRTFFCRGEERFHGSVVSGWADPAHRADHVVTVEGVDELTAAELRPAVGVNDTAGHVLAAGDSVLQGGDRESGLHP